MKTAILSVGTEILFGQIANTNTVFLSQQLNQLGFDVMYHYTVGDNALRLNDIIALAFRDCDLVITTGGLGPTQDDLTKETVCIALHDHLVKHEPSMRALEESFKRYNSPITQNNFKQAMMPSRAIVFDNDAGTAPGFALEENGKTVVCMPGPPREMTRMFEKKIKPFLEEKSDGVIYYRMIRTIGIGESALETVLLPLINGQTDPTLATYAKEGECCLRIASKRKTRSEAEATVDNMLMKVKNIIGQYIYSEDDEELADVVSKMLVEKNISVSAAESCTGGLFSGRLVDFPGISSIFNRGITTYSNIAKIEELGVKSETLEKFGAVSEETALEMAEGLKNKTGSRLCISVTGIAGPDGGSKEKPVGLIYLGVVFDDKKTAKKILLRDMGRKWVRNRAVFSMFSMIYDIIK